MTKFIVGLVLLTVIAVAAPFFIPGPNGEPLMNIERVRRALGGEWEFMRQAKQIGHTVQKKTKAIVEKVQIPVKPKVVENFDAPVESPEETLFKWRDKSGKWRYSNKLPPDGVDFEVVE